MMSDDQLPRPDRAVTMRSSVLQAVKWLRRETPLVVWLVLLSIGLALSEGISVSLLIPALDSSALTGVLSAIPMLSGLVGWLAQIPADQRLLAITGMLALALLVRGGMQLGSQFFAAVIPLRLQCAIMSRCYEALLEADLAYMPERKFGELQAVLRDHPLRASTVLNGLLTTLVSLILIAVFGLLILLVSWQMTLAAIVFIALTHFIMQSISHPWFLWGGQRLSKVTADLNGGVIETLYGLALIKLRAAEPLMKRRFGHLVDHYRHVETKRSFFSELQSPVQSTVSGLFICVLLIIAVAIYGGSDRSWTGLFIFFILCLYRLTGPASRLITAQSLIASNIDAFDETERFIAQADRSRLPNGSRRFEHIKEGVQLDRVTLVYDTGRAAAVEDASLEVRRGEIVALVGASGAGKTSILMLLMRFRDPTAGRVLIDGIDLKDYDVQSWRRRIAAVSQDIVLFNDTVRNNLCFGLGEIADDMIWAALRDASAEGFVRDLPAGLDTSLGDAGSKLSGGQRQRLALTRALLTEPDFLILDEATSHLDSITEATIRRTIEASRGRRSALIVAHRLSTVRNADRIYVLERGQVVERGSHSELHAAAGPYRRLFDAQQLEIATVAADA
jgi:ABC-type multidrug transport system fused ATPase/permease subunit